MVQYNLIHNQTGLRRFKHGDSKPSPPTPEIVSVIIKTSKHLGSLCYKLLYLLYTIELGGENELFGFVNCEDQVVVEAGSLVIKDITMVSI